MDTAFYPLLGMKSEDSKLLDKRYLKTVKRMDYNEFREVMTLLVPSVATMLCNPFEFVTFGYTEESGEGYVMCEEKGHRQYPITITRTEVEGGGSCGSFYQFEGIAPHTLCISLSRQALLNSVVPLPLVFERQLMETDEPEYHQSVLVLDGEMRIAFLYDPNGKDSTFSTDEVHSMLKMYIDMVNDECGFEFEYQRLSNLKVNVLLPSVGGHNCVVCTVLFMMAYSLLGLNVEKYDALMSSSSTMFVKLHIMMYNAIGLALEVLLD